MESPNACFQLPFGKLCVCGYVCVHVRVSKRDTEGGRGRLRQYQNIFFLTISVCLWKEATRLLAGCKNQISILRPHHSNMWVRTCPVPLDNWWAVPWRLELQYCFESCVYVCCVWEFAGCPFTPLQNDGPDSTSDSEDWWWQTKEVCLGYRRGGRLNESHIAVAGFHENSDLMKDIRQRT